VDTITRIRNKAKAGLKTIVLPEYEDSRVVEAAKVIEREGLAKVLLLTPDKINPADKESYIQQFYQMRKAKDPDINKIRKMFDDSLYYAAMMVRKGQADGFVAGASHTTPDVARSAIWCLGVDKHISIATSAFIMEVPGSDLGEKGTFIFADCAIIPDPNSRQLACIALVCAELGRKVLEMTPRVAFLSYSTKGSATGRGIEKITEALKLVKTMAPELIFDGELQVDAAIVPEVAQIKYPHSPVGGKANVLIFPSLEAGNISYKLVQRLANARVIGPLILGLSHPCSDLSRGCSVDDIVDCVATTAVRAQ